MTSESGLKVVENLRGERGGREPDFEVSLHLSDKKSGITQQLYIGGGKSIHFPKGL